MSSPFKVKCFNAVGYLAALIHVDSRPKLLMGPSGVGAECSYVPNCSISVNY